MTIRQKNLNERSLGHANYSLTFHIIWLLAMLMLLTVSIVIRKTHPIYAKMGFITLAIVVFTIIEEPVY